MSFESPRMGKRENLPARDSEPREEDAASFEMTPAESRKRLEELIRSVPSPEIQPAPQEETIVPEDAPLVAAIAGLRAQLSQDHELKAHHPALYESLMSKDVDTIARALGLSREYGGITVQEGDALLARNGEVLFVRRNHPERPHVLFTKEGHIHPLSRHS